MPQFVKHLLFLVGLTTGFLESTSTVLLDNIDKKTKKSPEITVQLSEMIKVWSFRVAESRSKYVSGKGSFSSISSRCYGAFEFIIDCGAGCAVCGIDAISCSSIFQVNENTILLKSASIFALAISSKILSTKELLLDPSLPTQLVQFLGFVAGGGWIPAICHRSVVDLSPRALFLKSDPLKLETTIFPCCTTVQLYTGGPSYNTGKPVVLLSGSVGTVSTAKLGISIGSECGILKPISGISSSVDLVPSDGKYLIPATELLSLRDPFQILEMKNVSDCFLTTTFPGVPELSQQLRDAVSAVASSNKAEFMGNLPNEANKTAPLTLSMVQIRCLLLQMVQLDLSSLSSKEADDLPAFSSVLKNDFEKILQLSAVDYVTGVLSVLDTLKLKPGQLDILKNLLREEDINFLEKIVLRLWPALRHVQSLNQTSSDPKVKSYSASDKVPCSILAGEVQIVDSKIRALNHFPSVRILDITLRKNTGRWFYECTLLTDGLMQIGWADKTFRCDPVCGQGIGDHPHSWAFDGFRTKKWNVSCENYGGRWHVGDVVGVLIDMDLLEMSFYLNGHDLGVAFSGFHCDTIYPALSMNVRQAVRINYGQYNFIYPPSIVDGIRYHPISDSVGVNSTSAASPDKKKDKFGKRGNIRECSPADKAITDDSVDQSLSRESDGRSEPASVHLMQRTDRVDEDHSEIIDSKENSKVSLVEHEHKDIPIDEECDYPMAPARNRNRLRFSDSEDLAADGGADSKAVDISSPNAADGNNSDDGSHENESNGSDEDEDGSEEDDMDDVDDDVMDEEGSRDRREIGNRHRQDELNPELELRRQALIENLIGMVSKII